MPTGTVDLVTTTLKPFIARADGLGHLQHVREVGRAVLVLGRAHRDEEDLALPHRLRRSVVKRSRSSATLRGIISSRPGS